MLESLEEKASTAEFGFRWVPLNRAGDLCERAGDRPRALEYYGRAIDAMLVDSRLRSCASTPPRYEHFAL